MHHVPSTEGLIKLIKIINPHVTEYYGETFRGILGVFPELPQKYWLLAETWDIKPIWKCNDIAVRQF